MKKKKMVSISPHIQVALATAISIILMALVSKRVLPEPMGTIPQAIPPFMMLIYELLLGRFRQKPWMKTRYWVWGILLTSFLIIAIYLIMYNI